MASASSISRIGLSGNAVFMRVSHSNHHEALGVETPAPVRAPAVGAALVAVVQVCLPRNLVAIVEVVYGVKDGVGVFDIADRVFGERLLHAALEFVPLRLPVKIVRHEEAAAQ